ncbi:ribonuclease H2 subunit B isoform X3 [Motacilla alba alba]|uniref:ribonuclease H2 subunit B isoform X3 n=1 Tax=Motacilla alba alba TaxID=1094192 RepID=UPI0018D51EE7|nr:ribonuclease H2 subunit B isoform X3 [Motacilla alba alba]
MGHPASPAEQGRPKARPPPLTPATATPPAPGVCREGEEAERRRIPSHGRAPPPPGPFPARPARHVAAAAAGTGAAGLRGARSMRGARSGQGAERRPAGAPPAQWVLIAPEAAIDPPKTPDSEPLFTKMRNPSTGEATLYLFNSGAQQLFEVKAFHEERRSWFIGQTVQQDGRLLFVTPMDPLFLILYYLIKADKEQQGKFQPLDQVVLDSEYPSCPLLLKCADVKQYIQHVTEEKEIGSQKFHKYSQEKTLKWLKKKVNQTVKALKSNNISVGERVLASTFINSKQITDAQEDYVRYAHGLISEYIPEDLSKELLKYLGLPELKSPAPEPPVKILQLIASPVLVLWLRFKAKALNFHVCTS